MSGVGTLCAYAHYRASLLLQNFTSLIFEIRLKIFAIEKLDSTAKSVKVSTYFANITRKNELPKNWILKVC